ncbi:MAG: class A beta-lactamase [Legionellales bacterium]|nr:class A beta-lactamase [Legionellales bacterium]
MINFIRVLLFLFIYSAHGFAADANAELTKKINDIEKKSNSIIGITAIHIEKNKTITHNSEKPFFMASTIKLPIALTLLNRVDEKKDSLDRLIQLDWNNSVPGSGSLYHLFEKKKIKISLKQMLNYMLTHSDNSASDSILHEVNGPNNVSHRMSALGFKNISVNRSILEMFLDSNHVDHAYLTNHLPVYSLERRFNQVPLETKVQAWQHFENDLRDTTTSNDMAQLLVKIYKKQALSPTSTQILMSIMEKCRTGRSRLKGLLPAHVKVAHKTGTWSITEYKYLKYPASKNLFRFASDVGIITLPNNKGHVAIAVYVKSKDANDYSRSRAIAQISRAIYDHFMKAQ